MRFTVFSVAIASFLAFTAASTDATNVSEYLINLQVEDLNPKKLPHGLADGDADIARDLLASLRDLDGVALRKKAQRAVGDETCPNNRDHLTLRDQWA
jgi:hypothetical protein